jgi:hypothetical protein
LEFLLDDPKFRPSIVMHTSPDVGTDAGMT